MEAAELQQELAAARDQAAALKAELRSAADRLQDLGRLQADLAAATERAERNEAQLRVSGDEAARGAERAEALQRELSATQRDLARSREDELAATQLANSRGARAGERNLPTPLCSRPLLCGRPDMPLMANASCNNPIHMLLAAELEHEVAVLREKSYQLEVEVAGMTTELQRLKADLASGSDMIDGEGKAGQRQDLVSRTYCRSLLLLIAGSA